MKEIVDDLNAVALRQLVVGLRLPCADRRRVAALRQAVREADVSLAPEALLELLSLDALQALCARRCGAFPASREEAVGVLLAAKNHCGEAFRPDSLRRVPCGNFVALDFETANRYRNSACALSVVRVEGGRIVKTYTKLIRPPLLHFEFTYIHGITAADVRDAPTYREIHEEVMALVDGVSFIAAHNASFDASVLNALCRHWGLAAPSVPWKCTVKMARSAWGLYPTKLPDVCRHLGISLQHHDATSDATACARIVLAASEIL